MDKKPFKPGFWSLHAYVYRDKVEAENVLAETLLLALEKGRSPITGANWVAKMG